MKEKLAAHHQQFTLKSIQEHLIVTVKAENLHYWSLQLDIVFKKMPEGNTLIRGLYGPNPSVWTLFTFLYSAVILSILFLLIYEGSQYSLGIIASFSWMIPILLGVGITLYIVSQFGQKLGAEQTFALHHFLEDSLQAHIDIE
jgi:hypothetical protein